MIFAKALAINIGNNKIFYVLGIILQHNTNFTNESNKEVGLVLGIIKIY